MFHGDDMCIQNAIAEDAIMRIKWNLLGEKEQKLFCQLIFYVGNAQGLTIGGFLPLNWPTCVQVIIASY